MQTRLMIGDVDFTPHIQEGGIQYGWTARQAKSVVALDGTLYASEIRKRTLTVSLATVRYETLCRLFGGLSRLETVQYDEQDGQSVRKLFYVGAPTWSAQRVAGGNTYFTGATVTLEEK